MTDVNELPECESMEFDVVIVGAGPAGLSAAIRLKQVNPELTVVVLEKGGEVGAHILSGAVVDPIGIDKLNPVAEFHDAAPDEQSRQFHSVAFQRDKMAW
jgi:electron-transferring-flavoprotein dehydrogenase